MRGSQCGVSMSLLALVGVTGALACSAQAGVTRTAASVTTDMGQQWLGIDRIIDQSGMNTNYVDGATDFDSYAANTTHYSHFYTTWLSDPGTTSGNIDFDMGSTMTLRGLAMWANGQVSGLVTEYLHSFEVYTSNDASFSSPSLVGAYTLNTTFGNDLDPGHVFTFGSDVTTQYVRLHVIDTQAGANWTTAVDEIVFNQVPAPGAAALLGLGGLVMGRRRRA